MARYSDGSESQSRKNPRRGRIFWVVVAALFLSLAALVIWTLVRTRAGVGYGTGWTENHVGVSPKKDGEESDLPAALLPPIRAPLGAPLGAPGRAPTGGDRLP